MPEAGREPLLRYLRVQRRTDMEMRQILRDSARESQRLTSRMGTGIGGRVRAAQLELANAQLQMWREIGDRIERGMYRAGGEAALLEGDVDRTLLRLVGGPPSFWKNSLLATARAGISSLISRGQAGIPLSERVYRNAVMASGKLDRTINAMIAQGSSAREIAGRVSSLIRPDVPGGVSYSAMRLGRTELNNAFHTTTVRFAAETPWVNSMKWNLSGSHPKADVCDEYANDVNYRGGEPGQFLPEDVPSKPHPQCMCFTTHITMGEDEFIRRYRRGQFDDYLSRQMLTAEGGQI